MWTLLFDIDGTLLNAGGAGMSSMNQAFKELFDLESLVEIDYQGRADRSIADELMKANNIEHTEENFQRMMEAYYKGLPEYLDKTNGHVLPGVQQIVETLHQRDDVALGLLTGNTQKGALVKLGHFQLSEFFKFGGFGEDHFHRDQVAEQAIAEARDHVGAEFSIDRCWIIGDTPRDITCTRHVGASVLSVCTGQYSAEDLNPYEPDVLLEDLSDVDSVIQVLTSTPSVSA